MRIGTACCLLCAIALTLMLALTQALPAYASQSARNGQTVQGGPSTKDGRSAQSIQEAGTEEITFDPGESSVSTDSRVTGYTRVEPISVAMPAGGLEFQVDTKAPFQIRNPGTQIQSPGVQVRSLSVVPVKLGISQVAEIRDGGVIFSEKFSNQAEQSSQLVDRIPSIGAPRTTILILGEEDRRYSEASFEKDTIVPGEKSIFITNIPVEETRTLKPYGEAAPNFYGEYQFTVRPTLEINAIQADPSD